MDPKRLIRVNDFVRVVSKKGVDGSGLQVGDLLIVVATKPLPVKKSDPYLQRLYFITMRYDGDKILIPKHDNDHRSYLVDGKSLEKVSDEEQARYSEALSKNYDTSD